MANQTLCLPSYPRKQSLGVPEANQAFCLVENRKSGPSCSPAVCHYGISSAQQDQIGQQEDSIIMGGGPHPLWFTIKRGIKGPDDALSRAYSLAMIHLAQDLLHHDSLSIKSMIISIELPFYSQMLWFNTVKSSNFVTLFSENIFFLQTFFWWPHIIFRYWNLYRMCLAFV